MKYAMEKLEDNTWSKIPRIITRCKELNTAERLLLILIYSNENGFDLHYKTIMNRLNWSKSKVARTVASLKKKGVIRDNYIINLDVLTEVSHVTPPIVISDTDELSSATPIRREEEEKYKKSNNLIRVKGEVSPVTSENIDEVNHDDLPF